MLRAGFCDHAGILIFKPSYANENMGNAYILNCSYAIDDKKTVLHRHQYEEGLIRALAQRGGGEYG
jgi:hypothetical protein